MVEEFAVGGKAVVFDGGRAAVVDGGNVVVGVGRDVVVMRGLFCSKLKAGEQELVTPVILSASM